MNTSPTTSLITRPRTWAALSLAAALTVLGGCGTSASAPDAITPQAHEITHVSDSPAPTVPCHGRVCAR